MSGGKLSVTPMKTDGLGALQWKILRCLWKIPEGRGTVHDILAAWEGPAPVYVTVLTVCRRLSQRGVIRLAEVNEARAHVWEPVAKQKDLEAAAVGELIDLLGSAVAVYDGIDRFLDARATALGMGDYDAMVIASQAIALWEKDKSSDVRRNTIEALEQRIKEKVILHRAA